MSSLVRAAGYDKAVWAGLSMGGYVVLDIQRRHPEMVAGLALCDTKAGADGPGLREPAGAGASEREATQTVKSVMHFADATPSDSSFKQSDEGRALFARWIGEQMPQGVGWRQRMAAGRPDLSDELPRVTAPAAVLCGDKDPFSPRPAMRALADAMTGTSALTFHGHRGLRAFQRGRASRSGGERVARSGATRASARLICWRSRPDTASAVRWCRWCRRCDLPRR